MVDRWHLEHAANLFRSINQFDKASEMANAPKFWFLGFGPLSHAGQQTLKP